MQTLNIDRAAAFLGLPVAQLVHWALQGVGPEFTGHPLRPHQMLYDEQDLEAWRLTATTHRKDEADGQRDQKRQPGGW